MVEVNRQMGPAMLRWIDALQVLRRQDRSGRVLAKAYVKLGKGKVRTAMGKIGIFAASMQVADKAVKAALVARWAELVKPEELKIVKA